MKLFLLLFTYLTISIQQKVDPVEKTAALIRLNNVKELVKTFANNTELTIIADESVSSHEQAEAKLNSFFTRNPFTSLKIIHRVDSNPEVAFAVAVLITKSGNFRLSFSIRISNNNYELTELRIEEEKSK